MFFKNVGRRRRMEKRYFLAVQPSRYVRASCLCVVFDDNYVMRFGGRPKGCFFTATAACTQY